MKMKKIILSKLNKLKYRIVLGIVITALSAVNSLYLPYVSAQYINGLGVAGNESFLRSRIIIFFTLALGTMILTHLSYMNRMKLSTLLSFNINEFIIEHLRKVEIKNYSDWNASNLTQRIVSDTTEVSQFIIESILTIFVNIISTIFIIYYLAKLDSVVLSTFAIILPLYCIVFIVLKNKLFTKNLLLKEAQNSYFSSISDQFRGMKRIKTSSLFSVFSLKFTSKFGELYKSLLNYYRSVMFFSNTNSMITTFMNLFVLAYGGYKVSIGSLGIGDLILINTYFSKLLSNVDYYLHLSKEYTSVIVSFRRLEEIISINIERNGDTVLSDIKSIQVSNLCVNLDERKLISNFSYEFKKGNIYCLRGQNGTGKSTLCDVIIGLKYDYTGDVKYNHKSITDIDMYSIRKDLIGVVEQEPELFNETLRFNLIYSDCSKQDHVVYDLLKEFDIEKFDLNMAISENSKNLSGGEKQKIAIARAIFQSPDVLFLDEPTSALDDSSVIKLKKLLRDNKEDMLTIIVSHDDRFSDITDEVLDFSVLNELSNQKYSC